MSSLKKPTRCITDSCTNLEFKKLKEPERWICAICNATAATRPMRNSSDKCYECGIERGQVEFRKNKNICKPCYSTQQKQWRDDNKDHLDKYYKEYYANLDQKERWRRVKQSIERCPESFLADQMYHIISRNDRPDRPRNPSCPIKREFDLDRDYLRELWENQNGKCALTNISMVHKFGFMESVSIDRVDSSKGHVKGNIQLVCLAINRMKNSHSNEEVCEFLRSVKL